MSKTLLFAWLVSIVATVGSLFFSESMGFIPCTLCWYQRILMYPLVVVLGIAFYQNNRKIYQYVLPFTIAGMVMSGYHYAIQKLPSFNVIPLCKQGVPCSGQYINWLGFITIPLLSFIAFTLITVSMILLWRSANVSTQIRFYR